MSPVACKKIYIKKKVKKSKKKNIVQKIVYKVVELVGGGSVIDGAYPV